MCWWDVKPNFTHSFTLLCDSVHVGGSQFYVEFSEFSLATQFKNSMQECCRIKNYIFIINNIIILCGLMKNALSVLDMIVKSMQKRQKKKI